LEILVHRRVSFARDRRGPRGDVGEGEEAVEPGVDRERIAEPVAQVLPQLEGEDGELEVELTERGKADRVPADGEADLVLKALIRRQLPDGVETVEVGLRGEIATRQLR